MSGAAGGPKRFDAGRIRTYPVSGRTNKVTLEDLVDPSVVVASEYDAGAAEGPIGRVAEAILEARKRGGGVVWFTGAHLVKNGLSPLVWDLAERGLLSHVAVNAAATIHDFELALIGETSEHVPNALGRGEFGMAREFGWVNGALAEGHARGLGYGESMGRLLTDEAFREAVRTGLGWDEIAEMRHPEVSFVARCRAAGVPVTVHAGIGTDVIDQHASFDGGAKGGCSGRDFLELAETMCGMAEGVFVNVGSAVTGPEVLLKTVSMAANVGRAPEGLTTACFDMRPFDGDAMGDERRLEYYFRDLKSVVTRVPGAFGGHGIYVCGDQRVTIPRLHQRLTEDR
jgi:hypothetical protein